MTLLQLIVANDKATVVAVLRSRLLVITSVIWLVCWCYDSSKNVSCLAVASRTNSRNGEHSLLSTSPTSNGLADYFVVSASIILQLIQAPTSIGSSVILLLAELAEF